ncbi:MAG: sugar phosphate isomerase/epimerase family protein [Candidatus Merdivicinus sp.]
MKFGMSAYCLTPAMEAGRMTVYDVIDFAKAHGCEHIEFVPFSLPFVDDRTLTLNEGLIDGVRKKCEDVDLEISTYSVNADLLKPDEAERRREIERVKRHIDAAARLGLKRMRYDTSSFRRPFSTNTVENFYKELPLMIEGVRELHAYTAERGIRTTLENHGFFVNGSDRILHLIQETGFDDIRMTLDVGNFQCVDEDSVAAVKKCLPYAEIIHLKDFYIRKKSVLPGQAEMFNCNNGSWFETMGGRMLRGSILGQGDLDIWEILRVIKESGFDGYISLEFEGMEQCEQGTEISLQMARGIWERV